MTTAREILTEAGLQNTFWGRRIIAAEKRGRFSLDDIQKSEDWATCACGKTADAIPRGNHGGPLDGVLAGLGRSFHWEMRDNSPVLVAEILVTIEERAAVVLAGMKRKQPTGNSRQAVS